MLLLSDIPDARRLGPLPRRGSPVEDDVDRTNATVVERCELWYGPPPWPRVLEPGDRVVVTHRDEWIARLDHAGWPAVVDASSVREDS